MVYHCTTRIGFQILWKKAIGLKVFVRKVFNKLILCTSCQNLAHKQRVVVYRGVFIRQDHHLFLNLKGSCYPLFLWEIWSSGNLSQWVLCTKSEIPSFGRSQMQSFTSFTCSETVRGLKWGHTTHIMAPWDVTVLRWLEMVIHAWQV